MPKLTTELSPKEQRFVEEYPVDFNGTKAILRAGFECKNDNVAHSVAIKLLRKVAVKTAIAERMEALLKKSNTLAEQYVTEASRLARCDVRKLFDEKGEILPIHKLPDEIASCISSIEPTPIEVSDGQGEKKTVIGYKVRFWSKNAALSTMFEYYQLIQKLGSKQNPVNHVVSFKDPTKLSLPELIERRDHPERFVLSTGN